MAVNNSQTAPTAEVGREGCVKLPDAKLRRNPCDMDVQEGQERMQEEPQEKPEGRDPREKKE